MIISLKKYKQEQKEKHTEINSFVCQKRNECKQEDKKSERERGAAA